MDAEEQFDNRCDRIRGLVKKHPGISKAAITDATEYIPGPERDAVIDCLIAEGKIVAKVAKTRGRPKTCYWAAEQEEYLRLNIEVGGDFDPATMTPEQIESVNTGRRQLNKHLERMGLYPLPMLAVAT